MAGTKTMFDYRWDVDKYKSNYDSEHWDLCRAFMETHKTKYSEQKLAHLTEAFYQIGVYGSSYDPKTTRLVNALTIEVLDNVLKTHPGVLYHPFNKSAVVPERSTGDSQSLKEDKEPSQSSSIWNVQVDQNIIANVLKEAQLKELFKGFVIIYDIRRASTMNDNKVTILEESFKRSKFGPCHWAKDDTHNNICPIRIALKWRNVVLAEAVGGDEKSLKTRLAQAVLSKMANFSSGIEAKWSYYRDGRLPDRFDNPNPRKSHIFRVLQRSQFKAMAEITSYIDTFANSDSFAEVVFSMDFSNQEKKQLMEYVDKNWCTKLIYRTLSKVGVKNKSESHVFVYHIRSGEELRRWLEQTDGENDRYRMVPPGKHRRAGACDNNVREVLTTDSVEMPKEASVPAEKQTKVDIAKNEREQELAIQNGVLTKKSDQTEKTIKTNTEKKDRDIEKKDKDAEKKTKDTENENKEEGTNKKEKETSKTLQDGEDDLEKLLDGFVLFYDANKTSEIDKDDWFTALCESFKLSKFGPLEVISENVRPLRTRCIFKWKDRILATAEGLTETQAKTAATLQLISKLEPFTYIIQAKEEYFFEGKVPPFIEDPDPNKNDVCRLVRRKDLPSYYTIFQTIDEFGRGQSHGELVFGPDFTWELKNEIVVYLKAKGLSHRYFTLNDQKPWTHLAIYRTVKPEELKDHLLKNGGENEKYKLIPPPKAEPLSDKTSEESKVKSTKEAEKPPAPSSAKKPLAKVAEKRKQQEEPAASLAEDFDNNRIQIKLKKFKVDKVDYPEDTGGDFPGLILWIGIRKNSVWQKNLFNILLDSFKMSKYGELVIEESEENVWGRREPFKKCVIKAYRKVLAVGLGDSKTEAKTSGSLQVLRQLRKHCYAIQAKESYFKEGKATPYDFNPDPAKAHVYKLIKRNQFKDRAAMIKFVNEFDKNNCPEEAIFGDDFTYDEREHILDHCRKINLNYRLMKCQSVSKNMHTHIAVFHQQPLPIIKAELIKAGGENDMYRLVPPGGRITNQNNQAYRKERTTEDLKRRLLKCGGENRQYRLIPPGDRENERDFWPDTLESGKEVPSLKAAQTTTSLPVQQSDISQSNEPQQILRTNQTSTEWNPIETLINRTSISGPTMSLDRKRKDLDNFASSVHMVNISSPKGKKVSVQISGINAKSTSVGTNDKKGNASVKQISNQSDQDAPAQPLPSQQTCPQPLSNQPEEQKHLQNQPMKPKLVHSQPMGPQPLNNQPKEPKLVQSQPVGTQPIQGHPIKAQHLHNQPMRPQPRNNQPTGPQPQNNQPTGPQPRNNQPSGPHPRNNQPMGPQPRNNQPVGPQPRNNQPTGPHPRNNQPTGPQPQNNQPVGPQPRNNQPMGPQSRNNQTMGSQSRNNQPMGPQPLHRHPIGPQPLHDQPIGPQPQFVPLHLPEVQAPPYQEVPFGPQPLFIPPPEMYGQPFMDTPLQFGPNPPILVPQHPCDFGPVGMDMPPMVTQMEMINQPLPGSGQVPNKAAPLSANQTHISVPSVTITVPNNPQKTDLREELSKKRQAENRKISTNRVVYDVTTEKKRVINTDDNNSDGWSRKVFVAEPGNAANQEEQRREQAAAGQQEKPQDLREKLRHKDPTRETKGPGELMPRRNSPQRNFHNRMLRGSPEQTFAGGADRRRRSPHFDRQKMSPDRNRSREVSRERWRSRDQSEERIVRHRDSSHERRVFHDPTRSAGDDYQRIRSDRFRSRSRSRSFSPRRGERSPSPTVLYRDLWDNIPAGHSESIIMYKYVKQNSTTESDPYALLRATRSLLFNVDFDFIKEQTAIDEWYVSVELVTDDANIHPLVGEGVARTEREASRRAAHHAVDTIQRSCRVIEPNQRYFCEGGVPDFIARKSPMKTSVYEIIQNLDPETPLARYTVEMMFKMFVSSDLEDIYFLATDFSYLERVLVIEMATQMNLWWRLFGPRHPSARSDDVVSTQHVCVFKQKSALQLARELIAKGGVTEKYSLVDPREYRLTRPRFSREFSQLR